VSIEEAFAADPNSIDLGGGEWKLSMGLSLDLDSCDEGLSFGLFK
jgi:hypothetical protein